MLRKEIDIKVKNAILKGDISIPKNPRGFVLFSHGSGSSRLSSRNKYVANVLNENGIGTLLFDLLTVEEDRLRENRFNIKLLTERLVEVTKQVAEYPEVKGLAIGYFGASTGAASALLASARLGHFIKAVVSRGGRPDLAIDVLHKVTAPVLLIVGGLDHQVIQMNQEAYDRIHSVKEMKIVPGASHLFEERGKLEKVAELATDWYKKYLGVSVSIH